MNLQTLKILLEAAVVTVCLLWIAGPQAQAEITTEAAMNTSSRNLDYGIPLTVQQN